MNYSFLKNSLRALIIFTSSIFIFSLIMRLLKVENFDKVFPFLILYLVIAVFILLVSEIKRQKRIRRLIHSFYKDLDFSSRDRLIEELGIDYKRLIDDLFYQKKDLIAKFQTNRSELINYREIIEKWVHDIKTPLAASTLVIENNKDKMEDDLYRKLNMSNQAIKNKLDLVLYYARANSSKNDYTMDSLNIREVLENALIDFYPIIMEKELRVSNNLEDVTVISDYNTLSFIFSQLLANGVKYADREIKFETIINNKIKIRIINDGDMPENRDIPFIFEKSYTGKNSKQAESTGLGLYLVNSFADDLGIKIRIFPIKDEQFTIELQFENVY